MEKEKGLPKAKDIKAELTNLLCFYYSLGKGAIETKEVYKVLADKFELTKEQRGLSYKNEENKWEAKVRAAKNDLKNKGIVIEEEYGEWIITEEAINKLKEVFPTYIFKNYKF